MKRTPMRQRKVEIMSLDDLLAAQGRALDALRFTEAERLEKLIQEVKRKQCKDQPNSSDGRQ